MYTEDNRSQLLNKIVSFVCSSQEFEGLIQIGSGAEGFADIYSDIDLMAGIVGVDMLDSAKEKLQGFFKENGAIYLDNRPWTKTVLGISAYFENGLSVDISFMPTPEIPIRSNRWRLLWAANNKFAEPLEWKTAVLVERNGDMVDAAFHHRFFYTLRRAKVATLRANYIYADSCLSEARQMLLLIEAAVEGKKLHQFKAYHTLDKSFLATMESTYPQERTFSGINAAIVCLEDVYIKTVAANDLCPIDPTQPKLVNCFDI